MDIQARINQSNGRLKSGGVRVRVQAIGESLYLRATLPPKPGSRKDKPFQQRIALGWGVNPRTIKLAESEARKVGALLETGSFSWDDYLGDRGDRQTVASWITKLEVELKDPFRGAISDTTWNTDYKSVFNRLPQDEPLDTGLLLWILDKEFTSPRQRRRGAIALARLAEFAGLEASPLKARKGKYSAKCVEPRDLPSDRQIEEFVRSIKDPGWKWAIGMIAAYGLRPHEVFHLDLSEFPTAIVGDATKTGRRFVFILPPRWINDFALGFPALPDIEWRDRPNAKLGEAIAKFIGRHRKAVSGMESLTAYDLRHSYSRRCLDYGLSPDFGAKMMGHSVATHEETYRRWIDRSTYQAIYDRAIGVNPGQVEQSISPQSRSNSGSLKSKITLDSQATTSMDLLEHFSRL